MSIFKQRYLIHGWENDCKLTAKELYERIMADSKSDYKWIAPARELARICKESDFPKEYATAIKVAILNAYANVEHRANCGVDRYCYDPEDEEAVQYCYNSLFGDDDKEVAMARYRYLTEMIKKASEVRIFDSLYHPGPAFIKIKKEWCRAKFEKYICEENINFKELMKELNESFIELIKKAEAEGKFEDDEKREKEDWKEFQELLEKLN